MNTGQILVYTCSLLVIPLYYGNCEEEKDSPQFCLDTVTATCSGDQNYFNVNISCLPEPLQDNSSANSSTEPLTNSTQNSTTNSSTSTTNSPTPPPPFLYCSRDKRGEPSCATKPSKPIKCEPEIYERKCECGHDAHGRATCTCERYFFWKMYPFIYIVLGASVVGVYIVCNLLRICRKGAEEEAESEDDLAKCDKLNAETIPVL